LAPAISRPALAAIATPLRVAPPPATARKSSCRAEHRPPARGKRHRDRPIVLARQIGAGAVDRVDDPHILGLKPRRIVLVLFRQPAIASGQAEEPLLQKLIDRDVGFADR
jgi:hypothetical protein